MNNKINASLITAAPDLLEVLEEIISKLQWRDENATSIDEKLNWSELSTLKHAKQVIAKTKGE